MRLRALYLSAVFVLVAACEDPTQIPPEDWCLTQANDTSSTNWEITCGNAYSPLERCADDCVDSMDGSGRCHLYPGDEYCSRVRQCAPDCAENCLDAQSEECDRVLHPGGQRWTYTDGGVGMLAETGTGADGSDLEPACRTNAECTEPTASLCDESGECTACQEATDCYHLGLAACSDGLCVLCSAEQGCSEGQVCDVAASPGPACVGCLEPSDCQGVDRPFCDLAGRECVTCEQDSDCSDPAAGRCSAGECVPCDADDGSQCGGVGDRKHCVVDTGNCEQCVGGEDGDEQCGAGMMCTVASKCVVGTPRDMPDCGSCVDNRQCAPGRACIVVQPPQIGDDDLPLGECLPLQTGSGFAACENPGYVAEVFSAQDVHGDATDACRPAVSTCVEMLMFDSACHIPDPNEGLCLNVGPKNIWTVRCELSVDCPRLSMVCKNERCEPPSRGK